MARELPSILQLDIAGNPMSWITYEDAAYYYAKDLVAWSPTNEEFTIYGGNNRLSGEQSTMNMNTIIAIKGPVSKGALRVPSLTNKALFRRDQNVCAYCGGSFHHEKLTRDHIHPSSKGGENKWQNVVTACGTCNKLKDDRTPEQAGMKLLYVPYAPTRSEFLILMNRNILADQMAFLKAKVPVGSRIHIDSLYNQLHDNISLSH